MLQTLLISTEDHRDTNSPALLQTCMPYKVVFTTKISFVSLQLYVVCTPGSIELMKIIKCMHNLDLEHY